MSGHDTCGACRCGLPVFNNRTRTFSDDVVKCKVSGRIMPVGCVRCSARDNYMALEAEIEKLKAQRDALIEACRQACDWIVDPKRPIQLENKAAADILTEAVAKAKEKEQ